MNEQHQQLRVALVAGTLGQGGAEKQLTYIVQSLRQAGADVRIYSLTRGEFYEEVLRAQDIPVFWFGQQSNPLLRLARLRRLLWTFRPHIIQSAHSFTNIYAGMIGRLHRVLSVGALRGSLARSRRINGLWMRWLIGLPTVMVANSHIAASELIDSKVITPHRVYTLPNVIDLSSGQQQAQHTTSVECSVEPAALPRPIVASVGRLIPVKRVDHFLHALAGARQHGPDLSGIIIGDGPARSALENLADELGLLPDRVRFLGQRNDVAALLNQVDIFLFTSDNEGFPNVLLEAMAAGLPIITTPAGDAGLIVQDNSTGYVVPSGNREAMVERLARLAASPDLRQQLGMAGRRRVEEQYDSHSLVYRLAGIYRQAATHHGYHSILPLLPSDQRSFVS